VDTACHSDGDETLPGGFLFELFDDGVHVT
jgi:hypothetical protein